MLRRINKSRAEHAQETGNLIDLQVCQISANFGEAIPKYPVDLVLGRERRPKVAPQLGSNIVNASDGGRFLFRIW